MDERISVDTMASKAGKPKTRRFSRKVSQLTRMILQNKAKDSITDSSTEIKRTSSKLSGPLAELNRMRCSTPPSKPSPALPAHIESLPKHRRKSSLSKHERRNIVIGEPQLQYGSLILGEGSAALNHSSSFRKPTLPVPIPRRPYQNELENCCYGQNLDPLSISEVNPKPAMPQLSPNDMEPQPSPMNLDSIDEGGVFNVQTLLPSVESTIEPPRSRSSSKNRESNATLSNLPHEFDEIRARCSNLPLFPVRSFNEDSVPVKVQLANKCTRSMLDPLREAIYLNERDVNHCEGCTDDEDFNFNDSYQPSRQTRYGQMHNQVKPVLCEPKKESCQMSTITSISNISGHTEDTSHSSLRMYEAERLQKECQCRPISVWRPGQLVSRAIRPHTESPNNTEQRKQSRETEEFIEDQVMRLRGIKSLEETMLSDLEARERLRRAGKITGLPRLLPVKPIAL